MQADTLYRAEGLDPLVAITDDGRLMSVLDQILVGWKIAPAADPGQGAAPAIRIERNGKGWTCSGEGYENPITYADPVSTACSLIANLYKAQTLIDREGLVLHAGGVRIGGGVVLLTGHYRAGKSIFAAASAAARLQVFSDDIIPLGSGARTARAPGLAIRLRMPLPGTLPAEIHDFVAAHNIATARRYAYVCPPPSLLAPRGTTAPIAGIVSLRRGEGAKAALQRMPPADALGEAIRRNFAREAPALRILDAMEELVDTVPCLALTYDDPAGAVALLRCYFEGGQAEIEAEAAPLAARGSASGKVRPLDPDTLIRRQRGAHARERDGQAFLTDAEELVIFHLNVTGSAVWRLIEEPVTFGEITAIFAAGFPDRDPDALAADLTELVRGLAAAGLVRIAEPHRAG